MISVRMVEHLDTNNDGPMAIINMYVFYVLCIMYY